jgi:sigma-B regulation protein RsbU (phosphoserine phosphatase)
LATDAEPVLLAEPDFPIGLAEGDYLEQSIRLAPGDRLYLYSDGVTEATDVAKRQFGEARFTEMVRTGRGASLQDNVHALLETLARWQGAGKYQDDISVLAIEASRCNA